MSDNDTDQPQYTQPDPADVYKQAGAAFQGAAWRSQAEYKQSDEVLAAAEQLGRLAEEAALKSLKQSTILELEAAIAQAPDEETKAQLRDLIERVQSAKTSDGVKNAIASAKSEAAAAQNRGDARDNDMGSMHKDLYANDAVYRAKVDEITANAAVVMGDAEKRREASDALAEKHGIHTDFDKDMAKMAEDYKNLPDKTSLEARELEVRMLLKEREQNEARIKELEKRGLHEEANTLRQNTPPIEEGLKKAETYYRDQQTALLEAKERAMLEEGMSKEKITKELDKIKLLQSEDLNKLLESGDARKFLEAGKKLELSDKEQKENPKGENIAPVGNLNAAVLTEASLATPQQNKLLVAEASVAQPHAPSAVPVIAQDDSKQLF